MASASQILWAIATTVLFAPRLWLFCESPGLLAARLADMMLGAFEATVWVPLLVSNPHNHTNWEGKKKKKTKEITETFGLPERMESSPIPRHSSKAEDTWPNANCFRDD